MARDARKPAGKEGLSRLNIPIRISWIARLQTQRFDTRAKGLGLTRAQWRVIATIAFEEGATQSDIASRMEVAHVTAGRIIDRLEEIKLIERRADPADRRSNRLYLTETARPVLDELTKVGAKEEEIELAGLSEEQREELAKLLDLLIDNMTASPAPEADQP
jgi:MarR family transcriptional regulator, transcriptional regulator for hemolysin